MIKTVIFDLDGTLLNTLEDLTDSLNYTLREFNFPQLQISEVRKIVGNGIRLMIQRAVPEETDEKTIDDCFDVFCDYYKDHMADKTRPYDHVTQLLCLLKKEGFKTAVVSNKDEFAAKQLCRELFSDSVDITVGSNSERRNKPYPDNVDYALEQLSSRKDEAVFVGDSEVDIETAKNAKLFAIGVLWGFRDKDVVEKSGADYIVENVDQLKEYLLKNKG